MFYPGTKIVVVESSTKKKSIGIKQGSLCNIINTAEPRFLHNYNAVAVVCIGLFTRFGFEKEKGRMEKKKFINIFPLMSTAKMTTGKIDRQIEKIFKSDLSIMCEECGVDYNTPVTISYPINGAGANLLTDPNEFDSWFNSIMVSNMMMYITTLDPLNAYYRRYKDLADGDFLYTLSRLTGSKSRRIDYANSLNYDIGRNKARFIRRVMALITIYSKVNAKPMMERTVWHVSGKRKTNTETFYNNLAYMFFNGSIKVLNNISTRDVNKTIIKSFIDVGNHIRGLSHRTLGLVGDIQDTKEDKVNVNQN